jgi:hypothetical protein
MNKPGRLLLFGLGLGAVVACSRAVQLWNDSSAGFEDVKVVNSTTAPDPVRRRVKVARAARG